MKRYFLLGALLTLAASAQANEKYLDWKTRIDEWHNIRWELCKGRREEMPNCVVDGDTIRIAYRNYRIGQLDTPETRRPSKACPEIERAKGEAAKRYTLDMMRRAKTIRVTVYLDPLTGDEYREKFGRIMAKVEADKKDIAQALIKSKNARPYDGEMKSNWCE